MQKYTDVVTSARSGAAIPDARVTVKTHPAGAVATIYSDDGITTKSNPITTDSNGEFSFYAADGDYTLTVSGTGITERTVGPITLLDGDDDDDSTLESTDVSFTQSGSGALTEAVSVALQRLPHTAQYSTTANFNTANEALTGSFGMKRLVFPTTTEPLATYSLKPYTSGSNDTWQVGYNNSGTLYVPNDTAEPQSWLGFESNFANNPVRDPDFGTNRTMEVYFRFSPIGEDSTGYIEPLFFNYDTVGDKIIRGDIRAERLTFGNTPDGDFTRYMELTDAAAEFYVQIGKDADTTIGDSGHNLFINSGGVSIASTAITLSADMTWTRAAGALAAGATTLQTHNFTFIGDTGGTTSLRARASTATGSGGNAFALIRGEAFTATHAGSATATSLESRVGFVNVTSTGSVTTGRGYSSTFQLTSSGNVTTADNFVVLPPALTSTGAITTIAGFHVGNIGHATLVTNAVAFQADDITASATSARGIRLQLSAGAGKHNIYADGTAQNYLAGVTGIGVTASASAALALPAGTTAVASLRIAHGEAPTSPVNGDIWTTTAGVFARINGSTVQLQTV